MGTGTGTGTARRRKKKAASFPAARGGGGRPVAKDVSRALTTAGTVAQGWGAGAVQRIGQWLQAAAASAPAQRLGVAGALLGALALWKVGGRVRQLLSGSARPAVLYLDANRSVDLQRCRAWADKHMAGAKTPTAAQLDAILPGVTPATRHMWTQYYRAQEGGGGSSDTETSMDTLRDFRQNLVELLRQPPAPTTPPVPFILRTPRVEAELRSARHVGRGWGGEAPAWPISPMEWLYKHYQPQEDLWEAKDPHDLLQEQTPDVIRKKLTRLDPASSDGSGSWVLVPPSSDYKYPIEPMWTTGTPCPAAPAPRDVTFWTQQQDPDSENYVDPEQDALTVAWTQDGARQEAATSAPGRVLAGSGVVQWTVRLAPPCLEPLRDVRNVFEVSFDGNVIDRMEWTAARGAADQFRDTAYVQFERIPWGAWKTTPDALRALLPPGATPDFSEITFQQGAEQTSAPAVVPAAVEAAVSQNTEVTYGDKGGPYVWDFEDKPWEAPQYTDQHRAPPRGWSSMEKANQYRDANLRLFTLLHMQRTLRPLAERAAALLGHYKGLDLPNSDNPGIQSGCQLSDTLDQAEEQAQYVQTTLMACLDEELQGVDLNEYQANHEEIPGTSDLKRENAQLQRRLQQLEAAVAQGRAPAAPRPRAQQPPRAQPRSRPRSRSRSRPRPRYAPLPAPHNESQLEAWLQTPRAAAWRRMRYIKGDTARGAARRHVLARLLETGQRQMPVDEHDLVRQFLHTETDAREVVVFGLDARDAVVYVRVRDVPGGDRLCARADGTAEDRAAPCFSTPAQIQGVFRDAVRACDISGVVPMVHGPPLLLFWLGQVLQRLADRLADRRSRNLVASPHVQNLMLNDRFYPGADIQKSVHWLYMCDKELRTARGLTAAQRSRAQDLLQDQDTRRTGGGWSLWLALYRAAVR